MLSKGSKGAWIRSYHDGWFVGIGDGHYNEPLSREEALTRARRLAAERGTAEILVFDHDGALIERLPA